MTKEQKADIAKWIDLQIARLTKRTYDINSNSVNDLMTLRLRIRDYQDMKGLLEGTLIVSGDGSKLIKV